MICDFLRPRRGCGVVLPCAQSLLSAAGKCKPFRRSACLTKLSAPSLIFPRGCFFTHLLQKKKLTQSCEFFLLETGVDILSRARVRVIHRALLRCAAKCAARGSPITRCIPFASGKSFRSRTPRFNKTIRTVADFPSADLCLAVHGKSFPSCTKQKHPTDVECFCFGNRRRHTLPGRVQPSTICADELNFCVRYENRWDLIAIDTGNR